MEPATGAVDMATKKPNVMLRSILTDRHLHQRTTIMVVQDQALIRTIKTMPRRRDSRGIATTVKNLGAKKLIVERRWLMPRTTIKKQQLLLYLKEIMSCKLTYRHVVPVVWQKFYYSNITRWFDSDQN